MQQRTYRLHSNYRAEIAMYCKVIPAQFVTELEYQKPYYFRGEDRQIVHDS
jgi:hypothetical protein